MDELDVVVQALTDSLANAVLTYLSSHGNKILYLVVDPPGDCQSC